MTDLSISSISLSLQLGNFHSKETERENYAFLIGKLLYTYLLSMETSIWIAIPESSPHGFETPAADHPGVWLHLA